MLKKVDVSPTPLSFRFVFKFCPIGCLHSRFLYVLTRIDLIYSAGSISTLSLSPRSLPLGGRRWNPSLYPFFMRSTIDVLSPFSRSALDAEKVYFLLSHAISQFSLHSLPSDDQTISPQMPKKHLKKDIVKLANFYMKKGLAVVAISSNSTQTHPQEGPQFMAEEAKLLNYPFPYLFDETQDVARAFGAVCTPEFFLYRKDGRRPLELFYHGQFDESRPNNNIPVTGRYKLKVILNNSIWPLELFYHGQFDESRPNNNIPVTGRDLSLAIDCVLSAQKLVSVQKPSVGCGIKWHPEKTPQ